MNAAHVLYPPAGVVGLSRCGTVFDCFCCRDDVEP